MKEASGEKDDEKREKASRQLERCTLKWEEARRMRDEAAFEEEKQRIQTEKARQEEAKAQKKLKEMGVCPQGYRWIKMSGAYTCAWWLTLGP